PHTRYCRQRLEAAQWKGAANVGLGIRIPLPANPDFQAMVPEALSPARDYALLRQQVWDARRKVFTRRPKGPGQAHQRALKVEVLAFRRRGHETDRRGGDAQKSVHG